MQAKTLGTFIAGIGIRLITGIPDSTLQEFCAFLDEEGKELFDRHIVPANEGAAVGIAVGEYLSTASPACVYMQNSGLGNIVNPVTSLANDQVYGIPMLFLIGWRGEPGVHDEPQHRFMGGITLGMLEVMGISYDVVGPSTPERELPDIARRINKAFAERKQYALIIKKGTFDRVYEPDYHNDNVLVREDVIRSITDWVDPGDIVIATTGKISRELYESLDKSRGSHEQAFFCVGGMGHANMIAYQMAVRNPDKRVICLDGDGALLMHMGSLAMIGSNPVGNLIHICLDNEAHESVGGMYTGARGTSYDAVARACGYLDTWCVSTKGQLESVLKEMDRVKRLSFILVKTAISSRKDLIRPRETAEENRLRFMKYHGGIQ